MLNEPLKLSLINSVNDDENPDCGNMAMYKLFYECSMLDARNTLATDYFVMDLATAMKQRHYIITVLFFMSMHQPGLSLTKRLVIGQY